jgi:hypothetical protein
MDFKKLTMPVVAAFLFSAFALACLMVWLYKGKSRKWLNRKMKLGAAIITVTAVSTGCPPMVTCYDMPPQNDFKLDGMTWDTAGYYKLEIPEDSILRGMILSPTFDDYLVKLSKSDTIEIQTTKLKPTDGAFDQASENFEFRLAPNISPGEYIFRFCSANADTVQFELRGMQIHLIQK